MRDSQVEFSSKDMSHFGRYLKEYLLILGFEFL